MDRCSLFTLILSLLRARTILAIGAFVFLPDCALAQLQINTFNNPFVIDFDTTVSGVNNGQFAGTGFTPSPSSGQLDSDAWAVTGLSDGNLAFGGTQTSGDFARGSSSGGVPTGGIYAFTVGTNNRALGVQPTDADWTPGTITLRIQNSTGSTITDLNISYMVYIRNDENRSNSFNFSYSTDDATYTPVPSLNLTSTAAADATPSFVANARSTSLSGLSVLNNAFFYLRWSGADVGGSLSRDEFALDDISVTATPEPATLILTGLGMAAVWLLNRRRADSRTKVSSNRTGGINDDA